MPRVAPDVKLVDHGPGERRARGHVVLPVELVVLDPPPAREAGVAVPVGDVGHPPLLGAADRGGVRVEHDHVGVETVTGVGRERPEDAVAVEGVGRQVVDEDVPHVARFVQPRVQRNLGYRPHVPLPGQDQVDALRVPGEYGEVHAPGAYGRAEGGAVPARDSQLGLRVGVDSLFNYFRANARFHANAPRPGLVRSGW